MVIRRTNEEKGWISVPGIRSHADRTLEEQMQGLESAVAECKGKTVLDLGCAEGMIGREFARAGAIDVLGIEILESHLHIARKACEKEMPPMRFECAHMDDWIDAHPKPEQFDIVLSLGIAHKVKDPNTVLRFSCQSAKDLLCFRAPGHAWDGWFAAKHSGARVHFPTVMEKCGFKLEKHVPGARGEGVEYWRRQRPL